MNQVKAPRMTLSVSETLLAFVKNSLGSNMFRNVYFDIEDKVTDLAQNGNLSCAVFVSSILFLIKMIKDPHITVDSTLKDMMSCGWIEINKPEPGCVLVWQEKDFGQSGIHRHLGFYVNNGKAISNNPEKGCPTEHDWNIFDGRSVELILWHPKLAQILT